MQGHSPERSCPFGQTLALPAYPHVSRFFVVRIHSRRRHTGERTVTQINESTRTELQSATTETKSRGGRRTGKAATAAGDRAATAGNQVAETEQATHGVSKMNTQTISSDILNGATFGKFVLFGIPRADQVKDGPVMRGLVEVKTEGQGAPVKVQVAAWLKIGRTSGTEYLSLKVGNNDPEDPETYTVGPFYGRLFRQ